MEIKKLTLIGEWLENRDIENKTIEILRVLDGLPVAGAKEILQNAQSKIDALSKVQTSLLLEGNQDDV
ncbi:hypothetical protein VRU48_16420 [Pedobacter sp. KR3-3]|uniref:Ribosomal protein L7/L12 C-terminal domain-containing protein n=1 Tax=Pedobacter albus TaxID=3113905 RepID=A0ABU7IB67_9SPHI|nr:hypothetical protein [Pedobacter sp. KR3-3]MEE1946711.1 hypothetical protein [Pedobacter sp. KR3-3]